MAEYVICEKSELTAIADAIRDKTGGTEALSLDQIATEAAKIEMDIPLPDKVVYYNDMNGNVLSKITGSIRAYDGTTTTEINNFDLTSNWGDATVAVTKNGTAQRAFYLQSNSDDLPLDNGFSSSDCPGFTIGGWFCLTENTANYRRAMYFYGGKVFGLYLNQSTSDLTLRLDVAGTAYTTSVKITTNTWYHYAISVVPDSSGKLYVRLYINGSLALEKSAAHTINFTTVSISNNGSYPWTGAIKNIFVSLGALSVEEIRQMMLRD